jgi:hypothetical protein
MHFTFSIHKHQIKRLRIFKIPRGRKIISFQNLLYPKPGPVPNSGSNTCSLGLPAGTTNNLPHSPFSIADFLHPNYSMDDIRLHKVRGVTMTGSLIEAKKA